MAWIEFRSKFNVTWLNDSAEKLIKKFTCAEKQKWVTVSGTESTIRVWTQDIEATQKIRQNFLQDNLGIRDFDIARA